jgi:serine/threonine protein kinase
LHAAGIIHRDLKPQNLLLTSNFEELKIGDLGVACKEPGPFGKSKDTLGLAESAQVGTPFYLAPEIWRAQMNGGYTTKSDMWALGIILHELCYMEKPFIAQTMDQLEDLVLHWEPKPKSHQVPPSL